VISSPILDTLFLCSFVFIWLTLFYHALMAGKSYSYYSMLKEKGEAMIKELQNFPYVSIIVPAKDEAKVLAETLDALLDFDYPRDRVEIVVVNDGSTDRTKQILDEYAAKYKRIKPIHLPVMRKSLGKSIALNEGLKHTSYDYIAVYDADNLPERMSLQYLVRTIIGDEKMAAVCGKVRTINRNKNMLTRFINIEFISYQWIMQVGRLVMFKKILIPGTNYVIRKKVLVEAGGWDPKALTEDAELTLRVSSMGYNIGFMPFAVSWEQEPENWKAWRTQRIRWAEGNLYIISRFFSVKRYKFQNVYNFMLTFLVYIAMFFAILFSDLIFILGITGIIKLNITGPLVFVWILAFVVFCVEIMLSLTFELNENSWKNFGSVILMYFTYSQQWLYVVFRGLTDLRSNVKRVFWHKTERF